MTAPFASDVNKQLAALDATSPLFATDFVDRLLAAAREGGASDVHLHPTPAGLEVRWRIDGVLLRVGEFSRGKAADVVTRLKVLAQLLTYRADVPQEGRIQPVETATANGVVEMRVSTFPTLHGERAVVRLFAGDSRFLHLEDLGLPAEIEVALKQLLNETSGAIVITGPAGSGKTTTAYAALREIVRTSEGRRSIVSLEDPIESALPGVSQSQVATNAGFDLPTGLRSLMRQDPEVILVGEIRDAVTAETVFQAALTGHLVLSTFHAGGAAAGISRLVDMGIEPYLLRSGVRAMLHQRLVRRLCACNRPAKDAGELLGLPVERAHVAVGCAECRQTGYRGRLVLSEALPPLEGELGRAVLDRRDALELARLAQEAGMTTIFERACAAVESGGADPAEVRRVLGFSDVGGRAAC
jgi:type II secretory ATPase GspE/PulE/Tfp pilus assembly ATPase PilB-like protein